jgi:hypothetical protein
MSPVERVHLAAALKGGGGDNQVVMAGAPLIPRSGEPPSLQTCQSETRTGNPPASASAPGKCRQTSRSHELNRNTRWTQRPPRLRRLGLGALKRKKNKYMRLGAPHHRFRDFPKPNARWRIARRRRSPSPVFPSICR